MSEPAKCPNCRSIRLSLIETHEEVGYTDFGTVHRDGRGHLIPPTTFQFFAGDPLKVRLQCGDCYHEWSPRGTAQTVSAEDPGTIPDEEPADD